MKNADLMPNAYRVHKGPLASDDSYGCNGMFLVNYRKTRLAVVVSDGGGWDHVSVSCDHRCPTWNEMCYVKNLFWMPEEAVIQFHPPESDYVNNHPNCLHMWMQQGATIEMPPTIFV